MQKRGIKSRTKVIHGTDIINPRFPCKTKICKNTITSFQYNRHNYYCATCLRKRKNMRIRIDKISIPKTDEAFDNLCAELGHG